jgi:cytochrome c-type biogenesis protein CcmF
MHNILGSIAVLVGLGAAGFGSIAGMLAGRRQSRVGLRWTETSVYVYAGSMVFANLVMVRALLVRDFSVPYVAQVGSHATPTWVTIVSLWSSLEGSILFWGLILGLYAAGFTWSLRGRYREFMPYALGVILMVCAFFTLLIAGPANPFQNGLLPAPPVPSDGPGPNALLQNHVLMIIHPPMLYAGYVGMTIPFGIAIAALLRGKVSEGWLKPLRRWTMIPWMFLSVGIILGGWWAYEVLGWGGYWAWDPVENASFLPWLAATAYLHSTVVQERKRILKVWTLSLVISAFLLTILGTFMTRSGVFNSVHSFTQSSIGPAFLIFLGITLVLSLGLLAGRGHLLEDEGRIESPWSREAAFMVNNLIFVVFTFTVLLGTVFPLLVEAVQGKKISVGEPYFNAMAVPIGMALVFLMGVGPALPWGQAKLDTVLKGFVAPLAIGLLTSFLCFLAGLEGGLTLATFGLCAFAATVTLREMVKPAWVNSRQRGLSLGDALLRHISGNRRRVGGYTVHLSILVIVAAIAASQTYRYSAEASLSSGQSMTIGPYTLLYNKTTAKQEERRFTVFAEVDVFEEGTLVRTMTPRLNYYPTQREPVSTPHVITLGFSDLYLSLLSFDREGGKAAIKAYVVPMAPWLWWAIPILVLGSMISLWPRRQRKAVTSETTAAVAS